MYMQYSWCSSPCRYKSHVVHGWSGESPTARQGGGDERGCEEWRGVKKAIEQGIRIVGSRWRLPT